jgi:hypothetical protein
MIVYLAVNKNPTEVGFFEIFVKLIFDQLNERFCTAISPT